MTKLCHGCNTDKDWSDYFLRPSGRPRALCKKCYTARRMEHRSKNRERYREYSRAERRRRSRELSAKAMERYRSDPEYWAKVRARALVNTHLRRGTLERKPCQKCGVAKAQAHHYNGYAREHWLDIEWLCVACHTEEHVCAR